MASIGMLTVVIKRRSVLGTLARLPRVFASNYRIHREHNGRIVSAYAAWLMSRLVVTHCRTGRND